MILSQDSELNHICKDPFPKQGHIDRSQVLGGRHVFLGVAFSSLAWHLLCSWTVQGPGRFATCRSGHPCSPRAYGLIEESSPHHHHHCQGEKPDGSHRGEAVQPCGKLMGSRHSTPWVHIQPWPPASQGTLDKLFNVSGPQFSHI